MLRLFQKHQVRKTQEISGAMWDFTALDGEQAGKKQKVLVPSCWETYPGFENYRGRAVYETTFLAEGNIILEFKGVSHNAKVYIDEQLVTEHYGSYTSFNAIAQQLNPGRHFLKVEVDNRFLEEYALDFPNDYMSYGGISRGVILHQAAQLMTERVQVTPIEDTNGEWALKLAIWGRNFSSEKQNTALSISIAGKEWTVADCEVPASGMHLIYDEVLYVQNVKSWSIETPVLYQISVQMIQEEKVLDDYIDRFGFRTVKIRKNRVLLNGKELRIKGFCRHEDYSGFGCALPLEAMMRDLQLIKDMGANSVRTTHYPNNELFLDLCDEMGILVWEENHARGIEEERMKNLYFEEQCEQVIEEMITCHYNHPSIYIWGILNECGSETEYGRTCYEAQYKRIRSLDQSRPCSSASCKFYKDLCQDLPDICSWNIYPYWYDEESASYKLERIHDWLQKDGNGAGKPFLITEVGAGAIYGFLDKASDKWSENLQAEILEKQLSEIAAFKACSGMYIWQFCDVRVSREWAGTRPKSRNNKGIVDEFRRPKLSYEAVKKIFTKLPDYWDEKE